LLLLGRLERDLARGLSRRATAAVGRQRDRLGLQLPLLLDEARALPRDLDLQRQIPAGGDREARLAELDRLALPLLALLDLDLGLQGDGPAAVVLREARARAGEGDLGAPLAVQPGLPGEDLDPGEGPRLGGERLV